MTEYNYKLLMGIAIAAVVLYAGFFTFVFMYEPSSPEPQETTTNPIDVLPTNDLDWGLAFVSGTEYYPGQVGQVIVEARYRNGTSALVNSGTVIIGLTELLYDDTDIDTDPDSIFAAKFDETLGSRVNTAHGDKICSFYDPWEAFKCGGFTPVFPPFEFIEVMVRDNQTINPNTLKLGFKTSIIHSYTQFGPPQGYFFLFDGNYTGNFDVRGPVDGVQYHLDIYRNTIYKRVNGTSTQLADGPNIGCTSSNCNGPAIATGTNISFYKVNQELFVEVNGVVTNSYVDTDNTYEINNETTWGIAVLPAVTGSGETNGAVGFYDLYDVVNTSVYPAADCYTSIWDENKDLFIENQRMIFQEESENAYIEFTVPKADGVFEYQSRCEINGNDQTVSKSFHITKKRIGAWTTK